MRIRPARLDELEQVARIDCEADGLLAVVGIDVLANLPAPAAADYANAQKADRIFVGPSGALAGFVWTEIVDGTPNLEQVRVLPDHAGHGVGQALMAAAEH